MEWNVQKMKKQERLQRASHMMRGKIIQAENIVPVLESVVYPNDRVVLEGDNQKQATFLSQALASVDPAIVHGLTMMIPAVSRDEHLDLFEKGIASELNFAFAGMQSVRLAKMLEDNQLRIGSIHTYLELYARLLVDLIPNVCPVSYTHLDVYKRQLMTPAMGYFNAFSGIFSGAGYHRYAAFISILRLWGFRLPLIFLFKTRCV